MRLLAGRDNDIFCVGDALDGSSEDVEPRGVAARTNRVRARSTKKSSRQSSGIREPLTIDPDCCRWRLRVPVAVPKFASASELANFVQSRCFPRRRAVEVSAAAELAPIAVLVVPSPRAVALSRLQSYSDTKETNTGARRKQLLNHGSSSARELSVTGCDVSDAFALPMGLAVLN
jgi:hypothetical protein